MFSIFLVASFLLISFLWFYFASCSNLIFSALLLQAFTCSLLVISCAFVVTLAVFATLPWYQESKLCTRLAGIIPDNATGLNDTLCSSVEVLANLLGSISN